MSELQKWEKDNKIEINRPAYKTGQKVRVTQPTFGGETRDGFVAKKDGDNYFVVKLEFPFSKINRRSPWLKLCRDYAYQSVEEI